MAVYNNINGFRTDFQDWNEERSCNINTFLKKAISLFVIMVILMIILFLTFKLAFPCSNKNTERSLVTFKCEICVSDAYVHNDD